jgi:tetratricopeptide (TPR) repeat protein
MLSFFKRRKADGAASVGAAAAPVASVAERASLLWKQGSRLLERKRYARAVEVMEQAYELEPSRLDGRLNFGAALYLANRPAEAVPHLKYVLALEPQNTSALLNLAACYDALELMDKSIVLLEQLVADRPQWKDAHYNLAVAYFKQELFDKAEEALKAELRINPRHDAARTLLNKIHLMLPHQRQKASGEAASSA